MSGPDDGFVIEILLIGVLLLLNGFFAGAEIAVLTARRGRIQTLADRDRRAAALLRLKSDTPGTSTRPSAPTTRSSTSGV